MRPRLRIRYEPLGILVVGGYASGNGCASAKVLRAPLFVIKLARQRCRWLELELKLAIKNLPGCGVRRSPRSLVSDVEDVTLPLILRVAFEPAIDWKQLVQGCCVTVVRAVDTNQ